MTEQSGLPSPGLPPVAVTALRPYGQLVRISAAAAASMRPGAEGWVVDILPAPLGVHYLIEFDDGAMVELPAALVLDHPG